MGSEPNENQTAVSGRSTRRSGTVAAFLSFIFPGAGQVYLGDRRRGILFALPLIALIFFVLVVVATRAILRFADPTLMLIAIAVMFVYGLWWIAAIVDAYMRGARGRAPAAVFVAILVLLIGGADVFGAVQALRIRNAVINIGAINPLDATPPPATPSPTPLPPGQTLDPLATPTQRPPDYVDPREEPTNEPEPTIEPGPTPGLDITQIDAEADGLLNVLLAGLDWQPGRTSKRTDTILVVSANSETGEVLMFSFPRDIARFPLYNGGTFNGKINTFAGFANRSPEAYPEGGMRSLAYQVGYLLGIPIDYYASVNMPGFMSVVELVGGVTVTNTRNISDDNLQFYLEPGTYRLNAADALRYVRTRKGSGGDFGRAERQQQVLSALRKEFLKPDNLTKMPEIVEALSQVINTDFPPGQIDQLLDVADMVESEPSETWVFKYPQWAVHLRRAETCGRSVIFLRMDRIAELSIERFGEKSLWYGRTPPGPPPLRDCPPATSGS